MSNLAHQLILARHSHPFAPLYRAAPGNHSALRFNAIQLQFDYNLEPRHVKMIRWFHRLVMSGNAQYVRDELGQEWIRLTHGMISRQLSSEGWPTSANRSVVQLRRLTRPDGLPPILEQLMLGPSRDQSTGHNSGYNMYFRLNYDLLKSCYPIQTTAKRTYPQEASVLYATDDVPRPVRAQKAQKWALGDHVAHLVDILLKMPLNPGHADSELVFRQWAPQDQRHYTADINVFREQVWALYNGHFKMPDNAAFWWTDGRKAASRVDAVVGNWAAVTDLVLDAARHWRHWKRQMLQAESATHPHAGRLSSLTLGQWMMNVAYQTKAVSSGFVACLTGATLPSEYCRPGNSSWQSSTTEELATWVREHTPATQQYAVSQGLNMALELWNEFLAPSKDSSIKDWWAEGNGFTGWLNVLLDDASADYPNQIPVYCFHPTSNWFVDWLDRRTAAHGVPETVFNRMMLRIKEWQLLKSRKTA